MEEIIVTVSIERLQEKYGEYVEGYPGTNGVERWQLFYADEENEEIFIISSNTLVAPQPTDEGIPIENYTIDNIKNDNNLKYLRNYNNSWYKQYTADTLTDNVKAIAWLCDSNNWNGKYKTGKARYATGGPTLELLIASLEKKQVKSLNIDSTTDLGYSQIENLGVESGSMYNDGVNNYWLASHGGASGIYVRYVYCEDGGIYGRIYNQLYCGLRPVVCIPLYAIKLTDNGKLKIK